MKIKPLTIMTAMALITIVSNARAEIASKAYVDDQDNTLIFGTTSPAAPDIATLEENGGVTGILTNTVAMTQSEANAFLMTGREANVVTGTGGVIKNEHINRYANIQLGKLEMPTPGNDCTTKGCVLMFYNNKYVWEVIGRDTNESISTTGYVDATPDNDTGTFSPAEAPFYGAPTGTPTPPSPPILSEG